MTASARWLDPDKAELVTYIYSRKSQLGDGGNLVKLLANGAATHFAELGAPTKGGPKTAKACQTQWKAVCTIFIKNKNNYLVY